MKITDVKIEKFSIELTEPLKVAFAEVSHSVSLLIKVETDEGICGYGEAAPFAPARRVCAMPVAQSIRDFGFRVPILIDREGTIIAGHTRYKAAQLLGLGRVPCILVDDLTEAQVRAFRIADNKVAEASSWNDDVLRAEMEALKALDVDLEQTGFSEMEIDGILREMQDSDFEDFFIKPVEKPAVRSQEEPARRQDDAEPEQHPSEAGTAPRCIQCPHCGEWFEA